MDIYNFLCFLGKPGANITCTVTGSQRYSRDLPQGGMGIPCIMRFTGDKTTVRKAFTLLNEKESHLLILQILCHHQLMAVLVFICLVAIVT